MQLKIVKSELSAKRRKFRKKALKNCDFSVVSFPKSGRTWLRNILSLYWSELYSTQVEYDFGLTKKHINQKVHFPRVYFTHNYFDYFQDVKVDVKQFIDQRLLVRTKPIFLFRHPLDVLVSYYYQKVYREEKFAGHISEFINDSTFGLDRISRFMQQALELSDQNGYKSVSYEQLSDSPEEVISEVLTHWQIPINDNLLRLAIEQSSFEVMRKKELQSIEQPSEISGATRLGAGNKNGDPRAFKVRVGKVAGFKKEISAELHSDANSIDSYRRVLYELEKRNLIE